MNSSDFDDEVDNNLTEHAFGVASIQISKHAPEHAVPPMNMLFDIVTLEGDSLVVEMTRHGYQARKHLWFCGVFQQRF
jgi:hypothetical protein